MNVEFEVAGTMPKSQAHVLTRLYDRHWWERMDDRPDLDGYFESVRLVRQKLDAEEEAKRQAKEATVSDGTFPGLTLRDGVA
jgi:hypothetical protein